MTCFCGKVAGGKSIPVSYFLDSLNLAVLLLLSCLLQILGGYALTSASNNQGALVEFRTKNQIKSEFWLFVSYMALGKCVKLSEPVLSHVKWKNARNCMEQFPNAEW